MVGGGRASFKGRGVLMIAEPELNK